MMEMNWVVRGKAAMNAGQNFAGGVMALVDASVLPGWLKPALKSGGRGLYLSNTLHFDHPEVGKFKLELEYAYVDWARTLEQVQLAYIRAVELRLKRQQDNDNLIRDLLMDGAKCVECWVDADVDTDGNGGFYYKLKEDGIFAPGFGKLLAETYSQAMCWAELLEHATEAGHLRAQKRMADMRAVYEKDMAARREKEKDEADKKQRKADMMSWVARMLIRGNAEARLEEGFLGMNEIREALWQALASDIRDAAGCLELQRVVIYGERALDSEAKTLDDAQYAFLKSVRELFTFLDRQCTLQTLLASSTLVKSIIPGYLKVPDELRDTFAVRVVLHCPALDCDLGFTFVEKKGE